MNNEDKLYLPFVSLDYGNSQTLEIKWEKVCKILPMILVTSLYQIFAVSPLLLYLPCSVLRDKKIPRNFQVSRQNVPSFSPTQACQTCSCRACGLPGMWLAGCEFDMLTNTQNNWRRKEGILNKFKRLSPGALKCRDQHSLASPIPPGIGLKQED